VRPGAVFLDYDRERLDGLLDARARVPDHERYTDRFSARSARLRARLPEHLDLRYGSRPRERLDLFLPPVGVPRPLPVNLFFHGGYWRSSDKERYSFVAETFLAAGMACAVVEYALIPTVDLDRLVEQCRASVAFVYAHADELGLDRRRIHVSGHSAGGQIVGMLMAAGGWNGAELPDGVIRGGCGISGLYDLEPIRLSYLNDTLGLDAEAAAGNSPSLLRPAGPAPLILAVGGLEGEEFLRQSALMAKAWGDEAAVTSLVLDGLHHYSAVEALGAPESELAAAVVAQMATEPPRPGVPPA
jgi:arylformamidase